MPQLKISQGTIYYHVLGEGSPVVLLRGLGRSSRYWLGFDKILAKNFKVICVDARGLGQSTEPAGWGLSIKDLAADVQQLLQHLGIKSAHIVGISLGGMVALALGLYFRESCLSLTVMNASIAGSRHLRLTPKALLTIGRVLWDRRALHARLAEVLLAPNASESLRQTTAARWQEIEFKEGFPIVTIIKQLLAAARFDVRRKLPQLKIPTLVILGDVDQFVAGGNSRFIHALIPGAKFVLIPGGGHEITVDKPKEVVDAITAFVNERAASPK